jgi:hypothetical protein
LVPPGLQLKVHVPVVPTNVTQSALLEHATHVATPIGLHHPAPLGSVLVVVPVLHVRPQTLPATQQTTGPPQATGRSGGHGLVQPFWPHTAPELQQ